MIVLRVDDLIFTTDPEPVIPLVAVHQPSIDDCIAVLVLYLVIFAIPFVFGGRIRVGSDLRVLLLYGGILLLPFVLGRVGFL